MDFLGKLKAMCRVIGGYIYKWLIDFQILRIPALKHRTKMNEEKYIIVSMTSYGRRIISNVVYYSLVSALRQSKQPDRIVLWIDKTKWNENNLPQKLKKLVEKGVEFKFCDDIRSYTKLIPALIEYPDDIIITLDDDVIYPSNTIQQLYDAHLKNPTAICSFNSLKIQVDEGIPCNYDKWVSCTHDMVGDTMIFPCGFQGVLYPPYALDKDVINSDVFMKVCPLADDIWFWFCGTRKHTKRVSINRKGSLICIDALYQFIHKGTALSHSNVTENENDKQFKDLFKYYQIKISNDKLVEDSNSNNLKQF